MPARLTTILLFGRTGQVATEMRRRVPGDVRLVALGRKEADLVDPEACARTIREAECDAIINTAAYTAVDRAEEEEDLAVLINAAAPGAMARAAAARGVPFIHLSTDYVFDGSGERPWRPEDRPAPLSAYGRSKLLGEEAVRAAGGAHVVLRTSWIFSAHGKNFVKTMIRIAAEKNRLAVVADQVGGPTPASAIADALFAIARNFGEGKGVSGTFHYSGAPDVSWADFARAIFSQASLDVAVDEIPTSAYPTPARRPLNSRLDCRALRESYGIERPDWRAGLTQVLNEMAAGADGKT